MRITQKLTIILLLIIFSFACKRREDIKILDISTENIELQLEKVQDCSRYECNLMFRDKQERIVKKGFSDIKTLINMILKNNTKFIFTVTKVTSDEGETSSCITKVYNDKGILKENDIPIKGDIFWNYRCDTFEYSKCEASDFDVAIQEVKDKIKSIADKVKSVIKTNLPK